MVVEDEADIRNAIRQLLTDEGYDVAVAGDLDAARRRLIAQRMHCIVLDLGLPDGTADELVRDLARSPDAPAVVVMSAAINAAEIARHYGVLYLRKPFELELVLAAVKVASSQQMRPVVLSSDDAPTVRFRRDSLKRS